jgi:hypothetical protein
VPSHGCAWTLAGHGPRAALLRRFPFPLLRRLPFCFAPPRSRRQWWRSCWQRQGAGEREWGVWDRGRWLGCSIPRDARAAGLAAFCSRFCRCSTGCSIPWRQSKSARGYLLISSSHIKGLLASIGFNQSGIIDISRKL